MTQLLREFAYCTYCVACSQAMFVWILHRAPTSTDVLINSVFCIVALAAVYWRTNVKKEAK